MDEAHRRRIKKHQQMMKTLAQRRKIAQEKNPNKRAKMEQQANKVVRALPVPDDIVASDFDNVCYIVGGGPSLTTFDWSKLDGKFCIAINRSYEILPNAQIVYFTDDDFWQRHKKGMTAHSGKKYRGRLARKPVIKHPDVLELQLQPQPSGWSDQFGELYHGNNSGFACIQVAAQLGFTTIYLLGFDMMHQGTYNKGKKNCKGTTHWHDGHRRIDPATAYKMFLKNYAQMVKPVQKRNLKVINVNNPKHTALKFFPIQPFEEVFK